MRLFAFICVLAVLSGPALAARVTVVVDGDTVVLDDGREVRLVGIQAPKLPLGRVGFKAWPLAAEAKSHLEDIILNREVDVRPGDTVQDRHGRVLAHLVRVDDGLWVQGAMLGAGLARVYTFPDNRKRAAEMLAREAQARGDSLGMWALPHYAVRSPENVRFDLEQDGGGYHLVEGRVLDAQQVKKWVYLNFGADWRTDFTVRVDARKLDLFDGAGIDLLGLKGARVRVRGWLVEQSGPMIRLDHPERLEVLTR